MSSLIFLGYECISMFIPFLVTFLVLRNLQRKKGQFQSRAYNAFIIIVILYLASVYHFTSVGTLYDSLMYQLEMRQDQLNLIPFSNDISVIGYVLNSLLFMPLGFLVPLIWKKMDKLSYILGTGFAFSFLIEVSQLLNNRRTDIDDLIMNTLGALFGYVLYKIWNKVTKSKYQLKDTLVIELPTYIIVLFIGRFFLYNEMGLAKLLYGF